MLIKSTQRAAPMNLANHLLKDRDADGKLQTVTVIGARGVVADDDVLASLQDFTLIAATSKKCQKHLYHVSVSPAQPMTQTDWDLLWRLYEKEFGLEDLPYIEVEHAGKDRPPHRHRVFERVDFQTGKAIKLAHTKRRNEKVARISEYRLGHKLNPGAHNRCVMMRLHAEGQQDIVEWMAAQGAHTAPRPYQDFDYHDAQRDKRLQSNRKKVSGTTKLAWQLPTAQKFIRAIAQQGLMLAQGNRSSYVLIDEHGGTYNPRAILRVRAAELHERWADVPRNSLPTVDEALKLLQERQTQALKRKQRSRTRQRRQKAEPNIY